MSPRQRRSRRDPGPERPHAAARGDGFTAERHAHQRPDDGNAFIPDPEGGPAHTDDDLAESLAEEFLDAATRGSDAEEELDAVTPEELGGPFVETSAADEFANDVDDMNPLDAEPEPLPRPVAGLVSLPRESEEEDVEEGNPDSKDRDV
jgi:hypothetical protein